MQVSVIIPTYNHSSYILQTLDSVFAQTFTDYEIIVVNDGSPDDTADVLKPLVAEGKIRYIEQPNAGQASARNRGIAEAQGEFIALLDDDDLWLANKLEWQVELLCLHLDTGIVAGDKIIFSGNAPEVPTKKPSLVSYPTFEMTLYKNPITSLGQSLIRRTILEEIGGFNPEIWGTDDYDLWIRASRVTRIGIYDTVALLYRSHALNASHNIEKMLYNAKKTIDINISREPASAQMRLRKQSYRSLYTHFSGQFATRGRTNIQRLHFRAALSDFARVFYMITEAKHDLLLCLVLLGKTIRNRPFISLNNPL